MDQPVPNSTLAEGSAVLKIKLRDRFSAGSSGSLPAATIAPCLDLAERWREKRSDACICMNSRVESAHAPRDGAYATLLRQ